MKLTEQQWGGAVGVPDFPTSPCEVSMATLSTSAASVGLITCAAVLISLVVTYTLYVLEGVGPAFLPMLSDTFVPIPGNYISRISLSLCGIALFPLAAVPYYSPQQPDECLPRRALLVMAMLGAVCLQAVGAVCESDNERT